MTWGSAPHVALDRRGLGTMSVKCVLQLLLRREFAFEILWVDSHFISGLTALDWVRSHDGVYSNNMIGERVVDSHPHCYYYSKDERNTPY